MLTKHSCKRCEETVNREERWTHCHCGAVLVKSVVDFGKSLPLKDLMLSYEHARKSDLFVVVGSSLVVTPAADMPRETLLSGANPRSSVEEKLLSTGRRT
jgi:NAD-dependent deacetylase